MSFDTPTPTDLATITSFCKQLYRKCRDAGGDYEEISHEILALHKVLLNLSTSSKQKTNDRDLERVLQECNSALRQLDGVLLTHGTHGSHTGGRVGSSEEMERLGDCRVKLISLRGKLVRFGGGDGDVEGEDGEDGELDAVLDLVDEIAARLGKARMGGEDDAGRWRVFRREILLDGRVEEGVLGRCKEVLISYIREIYNNQTTNGNNHPQQQDNNTRNPNERKREGVNHDHWLPSSNDPRQQTQEAKALSPLVQEENLKFPTSMKYAPRVPESRTGSTETRIRTNPLPLPNINTNTNAPSNRRGGQRGNSSSSSDDRDHEDKRNEERGMVIRTSDLIPMNQGNTGPLLLKAPPSPSSSFRSPPTESTNGGGFGYGSSPVSIPMAPHQLPLRPSHSSHSQSSHENQTQQVLAPDSNGNPIPPNAKWTRVTRRLISPEVLQKRGIRYESGPEWVAILGELRREDIEELAAASAWVRDERERLRRGDDGRDRGGGVENFGRSPLNQKSHSQYIPIPIPIPIPGGGGRERSKSTAAAAVYSGRDRGKKSYSNTDSDSDADSYSGSNSETETEDERSHNRHHDQRRRNNSRRYHPRNNKKPGYQGSDIGGPISGYPNPFGQPPLSPAMSFVGTTASSTRDKERAFENLPRSAPTGNGTGVRFSDNPEMGGTPRSAVGGSGGGGFGDRDRDRERDRKSGDRSKEREREREPDRGSYTYASPSHSPSSPHSHWGAGKDKGKGERERDRERDKERAEPRRYRDENYGYNSTRSRNNSYYDNDNDGYGNGNGERRKKHYHREGSTASSSAHAHRDSTSHKNREEPTRRSSKDKTTESSSRGEKVRERETSRGSDKNAKGRSSSSRWKENLTAAGIGGAAVSLLNVLSEAAEGL